MLKEVLSWSRKNIILNGNLHKVMNSIKNNKYVGKYKIIFSYFKNPFQREFTFDVKTITVNGV